MWMAVSALVTAVLLVPTMNGASHRAGTNGFFLNDTNKRT